ncbi:uncharacterized protein SCHCODRAFT_02610964 [Schizophyllum commune H4-8]|uniref:uncharacterized protein n=1 Tax=Schizophyllum commune (strain H4-8 / FGSC 9210) TaxID=578458 RepID=UPI00215F9D3E|nr:uncharacterized protein SCHCODRAFT_02610964 [Schizophyllum commune H4-8]KAI5898043.1 hypothetical protein SCHCODRAFT_02610964 [Schizophyllum commune H4-8]
MSTTQTGEKKGHVCPPSNAKHPSDRWESLFVYSFICKFTNLRGKVEGLETPMDFENALLDKEPNTILTGILTRFILNLRPQTRNLSPDQISSTVASVMGEYFKTGERSNFWDESKRKNIDPFLSIDGGIFTQDWDFKLKILRQLVEMQLSAPNSEIKAIIDRAWGVSASKHKKKNEKEPLPGPDDPHSQENLQLAPIGQDAQRMRYWVADDSPRIYMSSNPWRVTASFQTVSSTREEYIATIETLKNNQPPPPSKPNAKPTKQAQAHMALIAALESRIPAIDNELARVARVRRKLEQRQALYAQAELRETRTRRQVKQRYTYAEVDSDQDDEDDYVDREDEVADDDDFGDEEEETGGRRSGRRAVAESSAAGRRRSARTTVNGNGKANSNGKRTASPDWTQWRGERRSRRLGAPADIAAEFNFPPTKRARTAESEATSEDQGGTPQTNGGPIKLKATGAAALRANEQAVEVLPGKKKSRFWVYAVEPADEQQENGNGRDQGGDLKSEEATSSVPPETNGNSTASDGMDVDVRRRSVSPLTP